jgi:hypothetical protein
MTGRLKPADQATPIRRGSEVDASVVSQNQGILRTGRLTQFARAEAHATRILMTLDF